MQFDRGLLAAVSLCALSMLSASVAAAEPLVPISVTLENCNGLSEIEVRRVVEAEFGLHASDSAHDSQVEIAVTCSDGALDLKIADPLSRKTLTRRIDVTGIDANAHARLAGIAASELLLASWAELDVNPVPRVTPAGPAPPPEELASARALVRERAVALARARLKPRVAMQSVFRAVALVSMRRFFRTAGSIWGGGVRLGQDIPEHLGWALDAAYESGELNPNLGRAGITSTSLGGALFLQQTYTSWTLRVGAGLRLGAVRATTTVEKTSPTTSIVPWGWPMGVASVSFRPLHPLILELSAESSYAKLPLSASAHLDDPSVRGGWIAFQLGAGVNL